jgi:hypothetical protein
MLSSERPGLSNQTIVDLLEIRLDSGMNLTFLELPISLEMFSESLAPILLPRPLHRRIHRILSRLNPLGVVFFNNSWTVS